MSRGHRSHSGLRSVCRRGPEKSSPSSASFFSLVPSKCSFTLPRQPQGHAVTGQSMASGACLSADLLRPLARGQKEPRQGSQETMSPPVPALLGWPGPGPGPSRAHLPRQVRWTHPRPGQHVAALPMRK